MYTSTARTIDTPPPGTPAYSAYLAARQMALGLVTDIPLEMPTAPCPDPEPIAEPIADPEPLRPREPYDWTWRGPTGSIWPACHPNAAHTSGYVWLADEQRYHCLWCVSLDAQRRRDERTTRGPTKATVRP